MRILKHTAIRAAVVAALFSATTLSAQWSTSGNTVGASDVLGSTNSAHVRIGTAGTERARVTNTGLVGLGTTTPFRRLHLHVGSITPQLVLGETPTTAWKIWGGREFHVTDAETGNDWLFFSPPGYLNRFVLGPASEIFVDLTGGSRFGFGALPSTRLTVAGHTVPAVDNTVDAGSSTYRWNIVYACNGTIQTSDARLKENISDLSYGIDDVMKLHPVSYRLNDGGESRRQLGMLAQEIKPVIGEVVKGDETASRLGVAYSDFVPVLIKAIQDQQEALQNRMANNQLLREQLDLRAQRIARLEAALKAIQD